MNATKSRMPGLGLGLSREEAEEKVGEAAVARQPEPRRRHHHHHHHQSRRKRKGGRGSREEEEEKRNTESVIQYSRSSNNNESSCSSSNPFFFVGSGGGGGGGGSLLSSSTSVSVGRCSFGSDHDSLFPHLSFHLAGRGRSSGPEPDLERRRASFDISTTLHISKEADLEGGREGGEEGEEITVLDPAKHSFSLALRECQNRRIRSEGLPLPTTARKQRKRRPASLGFDSQMSDTSISSPSSFVTGGGLKKSSAASVRSSRSGMFPSPGTPNYRHGSGAAGYQKGWSSERVPLPANSGRRYGSSTALLPFGNGRTLPSKWEDAEKWICSPVSGDGVRQSALPPHHRRPKSKSGPLGAPAGVGGCYSSASPLVPGFDSAMVRNFTDNSPFMAGVIMADRRCCGSGSSGRGGENGGCGEGGGRSYSAQSDHGMMRSASVHGWSDLLMESSSSLHSSQDEKHDNATDGPATTAPAILRKDMATQMSPEGSAQSSPKRKPQSSSPPNSTITIGELHSHFSKLEVRDVQVDDRVTMTRWSKKHISRGSDKSSSNIIQWKKKTVEARTSAWDVAETAKCISKVKREEAKITAWENLQKAKAEAAIRKLEMKLEKKRSSSMDRILNKLRSAQRKAQEMRNAVTASQDRQVATTTKKVISFRKTAQIGSLSGCFTCHAF